MIADVEVGSFLSSGVDFELRGVRGGQAHAAEVVLGRLRGLAVERAAGVGRASPAAPASRTPSAVIDADDFFGAARQVQWFMDEPLSNPSAIPLFFVAQAASEQVKVVVSGEGADELFGGYSHYREPLRLRRLSAAARDGSNRPGSGARRFPKVKGRRFLMRGALPLRERFFRIDYVFSHAERELLPGRSIAQLPGGADGGPALRRGCQPR